MKYDLWFCRYDGDLYVVAPDHGQEPGYTPRRVESVAFAFAALRKNGHEIVEVGILPPEMIGLE